MFEKTADEVISTFNQFLSKPGRWRRAIIAFVKSPQQDFGVLNIAHEGLISVHLGKESFSWDVPAPGEAFEHVTKFFKSDARAVNAAGVSRIDAVFESSDANKGAVNRTTEHRGGQLGIGLFELFAQFAAAVLEQLGEPVGFHAFDGAAGLFREANFALFEMAVEFVSSRELLSHIGDHRQLYLGIAEIVKGVEVFFKGAADSSLVFGGDKGLKQFDNGEQAACFDAGSMDGFL